MRTRPKRRRGIRVWRAPARACDDDDPFDEREPIVGQPNDNGDEPAK